MKRLRWVELEEWTEARVARTLIHSQLFSRQLLIVPNTNWAGHECDLLAVDPRCMKLVEIEVKISRADLAADVKKDKWWDRKGWDYARGTWAAEKRREHPLKIWKHYYAMPAPIWREAGADKVPAASGIILLYADNGRGKPSAELVRRCKPGKHARAITAQDALDLARLAGLRMWDALIREENRDGK